MFKNGDKVIDLDFPEEVLIIKDVNYDMNLVMLENSDGDSFYVPPGSLISVDDIPKIESSRDKYFEKEAKEIKERTTELADRKNEGKLPIHLVPTDAIKGMAEVLKIGIKKYSERNWERGAYYSVPYSSLMRHLMAFWEGEDRDPESGRLHLEHVLTNAAFLLRYYNEFPELDDRPKNEKN